MKRLFDHNLSPALVNRLGDLYPESSHLFKLGLDRAIDTEVWDHAKQEGFIIVTKDSDFNDLCFLKGFPPKVIWIRRGNCKTSEIEEILREHYKDIQQLYLDSSTGIMTLY